MKNGIRTAGLLLATSLLVFSCSKGAQDANPNATNNPNLNESLPKGTEYQIGDYIYGDYSFLSFDKVEYSLKDALKQNKLVVINMWATWCNPCNKEFPFVQAAYEKYSKTVEFFALSDELNTTIKEWYKKNNHTYNFPMGKDTALTMFNAFGVIAYPTSVFIDRDGKIDYAFAGGLECWEDVFEYYTSDNYQSGKASITNAGEFVVAE